MGQYEYLAHHGIKGQKWGVRRYQNPDGTLTDAGRKRIHNRLTVGGAAVGASMGGYLGGFAGSVAGGTLAGPAGVGIGAKVGGAIGALAGGAYYAKKTKDAIKRNPSIKSWNIDEIFATGSNFVAARGDTVYDASALQQQINQERVNQHIRNHQQFVDQSTQMTTQMHNDFMNQVHMNTINQTHMHMF